MEPVAMTNKSKELQSILEQTIRIKGQQGEEWITLIDKHKLERLAHHWVWAT